MIDDIIKDISHTFKTAIKGVEERLESRIKALEEKPAPEIPAPEKGDKGDKGDSITIDDIKPLIDDAISLIAIPEPVKGDAGDKGDKGDSITLDDVKPIIEEALSLIPPPQKGDNGDKGDKGDRGDKGDKGDDGKDALGIEILPDIDEDKSYSRGEYATKSGGLWRSHSKTIGMRGWECIVDGLADIDISFDGERNVTVKLVKSSGAVVEKSFTMPVMIDKGIYRDGETYLKGDVVSYGGSMWTAVKDSADGRPAASDDWRITVRKGRDAKISVKEKPEPKQVKL